MQHAPVIYKDFLFNKTSLVLSFFSYGQRKLGYGELAFWVRPGNIVCVGGWGLGTLGYESNFYRCTACLQPNLSKLLEYLESSSQVIILIHTQLFCLNSSLYQPHIGTLQINCLCTFSIHLFSIPATAIIVYCSWGPRSPPVIYVFCNYCEHWLNWHIG